MAGFWMVLFTLGVCASPAGTDADVSPRELAGLTTEAAAESTISGLVQALSRTQSLYAEVQMETRLTTAGRTVSSFQTTGALWLRRPKRFVWISHNGPAGVMACVCDGRNVLRYSGASNRYQLTPLSIETDWDGPMAPLNSAFLAELLIADDPSQALKRLVRRASRVGPAFLETQPAEQLRIWTTGGGDAAEELVVACGGPQLGLRYVSTRSMPTGMLVSTSRELRVLGHRGLDDSFFEAEPPPGASRVSKVWDLFIRPPKPPPTPRAIRPDSRSRIRVMEQAGWPDPLVGTPAPDFVLGTLDGRTVRLSDLRGRHVVVLDFFATWCGPCRASLPEMIQLGNELQAAGLAFFAVDVGEEPVKVRSLLAGMGNPRVEVLLDTTWDVGNAYGANAIPRTVVIDRAGVVRAAYSGSGIGDQVRRDVQSLLR